MASGDVLMAVTTPCDEGDGDVYNDNDHPYQRQSTHHKQLPTVKDEEEDSLTVPISASPDCSVPGRKEPGTGTGRNNSGKSLGVITTRFTQLIQASPNHCLDLNGACGKLGPDITKRRLYDITNVLEGIGLLQKVGKSNVQWTGAINGCDADNAEERFYSSKLAWLKEELLRVKAAEIRLEMDKAELLQRMKLCKENPSVREFAYVTQTDIGGGFGSDTCMTVHAPTGTQLEVPIPQDNGARGANTPRCQIHLQSATAPIQVLLVNGHHPDQAPISVDGNRQMHNLEEQEQPIISISPPPHKEYFNLTPAEGLCDLFDVSPPK